VWPLTATRLAARAQTGRYFYKLCTPLRRNAAGGLLRDRGGRLNHRVVSVLRVLAAEPGLSNSKMAERVGISGPSHMPTLLARLRERGLIENALAAPLPFEANAWQLTASGIELETAIPDEGRATANRTPRSAHPPATTKEYR
jgi:hypothetical protein